MASELVIKLIFEQSYSSYSINCFVFFAYIIIDYDERVTLFCFAFSIMLHTYILTPLIFLSVNFGLSGENLGTSTI